MNPLDNIVNDNAEFLKEFYSGEMTTILNICDKCQHVYLTESGPSIEFNPSYCPFCTRSIGNNVIVENNDSDVAEALVENLVENENTSVLSQKVQRILLNGKDQEYNIAVCTKCNNRFIFLEEDYDDLECCPYCKEYASENMRTLVSYEDEEVEQYQPTGIEKYVGRLFHISLKNEISDNFILTDIDINLKRYRIVSLNDERMALWIRDDDIVDMFEFIKVHQSDPEK